MIVLCMGEGVLTVREVRVEDGQRVLYATLKVQTRFAFLRVQDTSRASREHTKPASPK